MKNKLYEQVKNFKAFDEEEQADKEATLYFIENNDDILTRNNLTGHMTASAWIVNKERTKILMIYHNIYKSWNWTGGHADGDDNLFHVVNKEIEEETGLKNLKSLCDGIYAINVVCVDHHEKRGKKVNSHLHFDFCYLFEADENERVRIKEDENSGIKWVDIDKVTSVCEDKMKPVYQRLIDKLVNIK